MSHHTHTYNYIQYTNISTVLLTKEIKVAAGKSYYYIVESMLQFPELQLFRRCA